MKCYRIDITLLEPMLGTAPMDRNVYSTYIAANAPKPEDGEEEVETINEDKGKTGFHRKEDGSPFLYDYVIKGFFKDAAGMLRRAQGTASAKVTAYKKVIDGMVFVEPRQITINGEVGVLERPLRAQTAQGERVSLASSETVSAGSTLSFDLIVFEEKTVTLDLLTEWLDYGKWRGLGQWRNAGYGRFTYTITERAEA